MFLEKQLEGVCDGWSAVQIAQRLAEMGDELEKRVELIAQLKEAFEKEFKMQSAFMMAYQGFSHVCIRFLSRTQGQMRTGWDQLYLLCYGKMYFCVLHTVAWCTRYESFISRGRWQGKMAEIWLKCGSGNVAARINDPCTK